MHNTSYNWAKQVLKNRISLEMLLSEILVTKSNIGLMELLFQNIFVAVILSSKYVI